MIMNIPNSAGNNGILNDNAQIGDIKITVRTDLGDKWLLCNGDSIDYSLYPELADVCRYFTGTFIANDAYYMKDIFSYNGTPVAVGYYNGKPYIYALLDNVWIKQQVSSTSGQLRSIYCYNGMWCAAGFRSDGYPSSFYTTDPAGSWTGKRISSTVQSQIESVYCYDGLWVAVGYDSSYYPCIFYTYDLSSDWVCKQLSSDKKIKLYDVCCNNGTWVTSGCYYNENYPCVFTTTDPTGNWSINVLSEDTFGADESGSVCCFNGTWAMVTSKQGTYIPWVFTTTNPSGTWESLQLLSYTLYRPKISCSNDICVITGNNTSGYPYIITSSNPTGRWNVNQLDIAQMSAFGNCVDGYNIFCVGPLTSNAYPYVLRNDNYKLPSISNDGVYTYIKAKN